MVKLELTVKWVATQKVTSHFDFDDDCASSDVSDRGAPMAIIKHNFYGLRRERDHYGRLLYDWGIRVVGKPPKPDLNPYEFAAEYVCGEIANALRLPVAKGVIAVEKDEFWYCSLHFNHEMPENLPPTFPEQDGVLSGIDAQRADRFVQTNERIACGITAFDIWVCNGDRSNDNIIVIEKKRDEFDVLIFDHGEALIRSPDPIAWLSTNQDDLGIGKHHVLAGRLQTLEPMSEWIERIQQIPEYFIREVVHESIDLGVPKSAAEFCAEFLLTRRVKLPNLIDNNRTSFPNATQLLSLSASFAQSNPVPAPDAVVSPRIPQQAALVRYPSHLTWGGISETPKRFGPSGDPR